MAVAALLLLTGCAGSTLDWQRPEYGEPDRPAYLQDYINAHYRELGEHFVARFNMRQFREKLGKVRVLFLGDHHRDFELHQRMLELITWCEMNGFKPALGLEAIGLQDMQSVESYLNEDIDMNVLRQRIRKRNPMSWLEESNGVDAGYFRQLLALAKVRKLPVFGLEPTPRLPLSQRDAVISRSVQEAAGRWPDRLIIAIVGHAHLLGKGRLCARVRMPSLAIGARMSPRLSAAYVGYPRSADACFLQTPSGILFFHPMSSKGLMLPASGR